MPELPEVEFAVRRLRRAARGREILALHTHHPSQRRQLPARVKPRVEGRRILDVMRRGKHQLIVLDDGATLLVHFRLNGDWEYTRSTDALPAHTRVSLELSGGRRVSLTDSRALCTMQWFAPDSPPGLLLGPEPEDPALTATALRARLARKAGPIKPALLDQTLLAGVGNIYAAEACWHARIHPAARSARLTLARVMRLLAGLRATLADGHVNAGRYHRGERAIPFEVYDREGEPCARCATAIRRIEQAGRGTWYCPRCQRT